MQLSMTFESRNKIIDVYDDPDVYLIDIKGLSPEGKINTTTNAGYDGSTFVSDEIPERTIDMVLGFRCDDAEEAKERLYSIFAPKSKGTLVYESDVKKRKIEYIAQKVDTCISEYPMKVQISLLCTNPFFSEASAKNKIMSAVKPLFRFPFTFNGPFKFSERMTSVIENFINDSIYDVWPIIELKAISALTNPSIMNINTYEKMKVNISLSAGEKIIIDTRMDKKTITKISGNGEVNCFNYMDKDFQFFKLYVGDNYLKYDADTNAAGLQTTVSWENLYGGV